MKRGWFFLIWLIMVSMANAQSDRVITYGNDLTPVELEVVKKDFPIPVNVKLEEIKTIKITNEEEWSLLKGLVPDDQIGTRAVSSVYIEKLSAGSGLKIEAKNLTLVTPHMFANAIATAGIRDAKVYATAPVMVSGTAALTGIYKTFEELMGNKLSEAAKRTAAEELVRTSQLGEKVGKERAATLVERTKEKIFKQEVTNRTEIRKIVDQSAREQNLTLTKEEKEELTDLLVKLKKLNLDINLLQKQLQNFNETAKENLPPKQPESFISRIIAFFRTLFDQLFSFVGRLVRQN